MGTKSNRSVIDSSGRLRIGKHKGELAFDISRSDPEYLRWMLDNFDDMDEADAQMIEMLLSQNSRRNRSPRGSQNGTH